MNAIQTKLPPSDIEAEKSILSAVLLDNDALLKVIDILTPDYFYSKANCNVYSCMLSMFHNTKTIDILTLAEELKSKELFEETGGKEYLESLLVMVPSSAAVSQYARIVWEKGVLRKLILASSHILEKCYDPAQDVQEVLDCAEQEVFDISESQSRSTTLHIEEVIDSSIQYIEKLFENKSLISGLPTGFKQFDRLTAGLQKGQLVIVAARPGMGKTAFCLNVATNASDITGKTVMIFSLEMSADELGIRLLCSEAMIDSNKLKTGYWGDEEWERLTQAASKLMEQKILIDDSTNLNVMEVRARCRRAKAQYPDLALVVIDYLQLMRGLKNNQDRHLEISEITRSLKNLAKELEVPVIALSQLSRAVESRTDKRPQLSDLRESGSIEQDADIVSFIYRKEYYEESEEDFNKAELIIAKNRSGPTSDINLTFLKEFTRFENYIDAGQVEEGQSHPSLADRGIDDDFDGM